MSLIGDKDGYLYLQFPKIESMFVNELGAKVENSFVIDTINTWTLVSSKRCLLWKIFPNNGLI